MCAKSGHPLFIVIRLIVDISFDPAKRAFTLKERGLDLADAGMVFAGRTITVQDTRRDYGRIASLPLAILLVGAW